MSSISFGEDPGRGGPPHRGFDEWVYELVRRRRRTESGRNSNTVAGMRHTQRRTNWPSLETSSGMPRNYKWGKELRHSTSEQRGSPDAALHLHSDVSFLGHDAVDCRSDDWVRIVSTLDLDLLSTRTNFDENW